MQYPFAVLVTASNTKYRYVVRANDMRQAVRRALRLHTQRKGSTGKFSRIVSLTPKEQAGRFVPRINGRPVAAASYGTAQQAVDVSLKSLDEQAEWR